MKKATLRVSASTMRAIVSIVAVCLVLPGCGGTKVLKDPQPMHEATTLAPQPPLASGGDDKLGVHLTWVIVRDGPGTWAQNADWDEYLLVANNSSGETLRITGASVYDSLGNRIAADDDRKRLVKASRKASQQQSRGGERNSAPAHRPASGYRCRGPTRSRPVLPVGPFAAAR